MSRVKAKLEHYTDGKLKAVKDVFQESSETYPTQSNPTENCDQSKPKRGASFIITINHKKSCFMSKSLACLELKLRRAFVFEYEQFGLFTSGKTCIRPRRFRKLDLSSSSVCLHNFGHYQVMLWKMTDNSALFRRFKIIFSFPRTKCTVNCISHFSCG